MLPSAEMGSALLLLLLCPAALPAAVGGSGNDGNSGRREMLDRSAAATAEAEEKGLRQQRCKPRQKQMGKTLSWRRRLRQASDS